jgi:mono/diheme cytochrome c family protein
MSSINPSGVPKKAPWWNPAKWFAYRRNIPIEQRSYTKIYGILAVLLFAFTVWAVLDEVLERRPWKDIQADFMEFKVTRLKLERRKELAKIPVDVRKGIKKELAAVEKEMNSSAYLATSDKIEDLDKDIAKVERKYTFAKSEADETYYYYNKAKTERSDTSSFAKQLREHEKDMAVYQKEMDGLQKNRADLVAKVMPVQKRQKAIEKLRDSVMAGVIAIDRKIEATESMVIGVKQTVLLNYEKTSFNNFKMRVDRCETCHLSYSDPLFKNDTLVSTDKAEVKQWLKANKYNDAEHYTIKKLGEKQDTTVAVVSALFRLHPNVNMFIKGHKVGEPAGPGVLGCTSCHGGQGPSITSTEFAHGFERHWTDPLATGHYVESSCQSCHSSKMDFENAQWISMGKKLFTDFGCWGCHQMNAFDGMPQGQGPSLLAVSKKVTPEWIYKWVLSPRGWEHNTRMPNFMFAPDEAKAVTAFLVNASKDNTYIPAAKLGAGGNPLMGKQLFFDVGCVGCHSIDEWKATSRVKEGPSFGPGLDKIGSKVTAEWLYDWIKNPKNYLSHSRMPSMRLTDGEASDLTAYLMQHTGKNDSVASSLSGDIANADLIGKGEKLVRSFGCFGCHEIKGMEKEPKVAVSLVTFGKKTANELDFGNVNAETFGDWRKQFKKQGIELGRVDEHAVHENRDWYTWFVGKMKNSRIYQTERIPQKMPNFQMSDSEAYAISIFLRSMNGQYVGPTYAENLTEANQANLVKGRMFVHWNNCVGCHKVENGGGYIAKLVNQKYAGDQNIAYFAPPYLGPEGERVQEQWLYNFLRGPFKIRPLVKFRMPTYGFADVDVSTATNYFLATHKRQFVMTEYSYPTDAALLGAGKALFDKLKCLSCHYIGNATADTKAPNLQGVKSRLRPEWVESWLSRPDSIMPGTPMTAFWWTGGKPSTPAPEILNGDIKMQIKAVHAYLQSLGTGGIPNPTPYSTIGGSDKYVMPNGEYRPIATNAPVGSQMPDTIQGVPAVKAKHTAMK